MNTFQPGILEPVPLVGRHLVFSCSPDTGPDALRAALARLKEVADGRTLVVGLGLEVVSAIGAAVPGLVEFPPLTGGGVDVPSTPGALWCWLRGRDRGELLHLTRRVQKAVTPALVLRDVVDAFRHSALPEGPGLDLTGYEDGTENPVGDEALEAAFVSGQGPALDGSSFVAVQQWVHDFDAFEALASEDQDNSIGRRRADNVELENSPASSHVKRTAQESFEPPAFMLRRSMPWVMGTQAGLQFVAFGHSFYAFDIQMRRMAGLEDGVVDAMFRISRPVSGGYFWCPPLRDGRLCLEQVGL
jgi:putative iron-dependent peroxidase